MQGLFTSNLLVIESKMLGLECGPWANRYCVGTVIIHRTGKTTILVIVSEMLNLNLIVRCLEIQLLVLCPGLSRPSPAKIPLNTNGLVNVFRKLVAIWFYIQYLMYG